MNGQIKDGLFHFQKKNLITKKQEEKINKEKIFEGC